MRCEGAGFVAPAPLVILVSLPVILVSLLVILVSKLLYLLVILLTGSHLLWDDGVMVFQNDAFDVMSPQFPLLHCLCLETAMKMMKRRMCGRQQRRRGQVAHLDCVRLFRMFVMSHTEAQRVFSTFN